MGGIDVVIFEVRLLNQDESNVQKKKFSESNCLFYIVRLFMVLRNLQFKLPHLSMSRVYYEIKALETRIQRLKQIFVDF